MFNKVYELYELMEKEEKDKAVDNERCEVDKTEALDIIATHILLCAEALRNAGYSLKDFEY